MSKRVLLYLLFEIIAYNAGAQKLSNWGLEVKPFIFTDDYGIGDYNWPYLFRDGYTPLPYGSNLLLVTRAKVVLFPALTMAGV